MTTKVRSQIGESTNQGPPQRKYVVSDETMEAAVSRAQSPKPPPGAQEISPSMAAGLRQQAMEKMELEENRALQDAKRRVEIITGIGRKTKDVPIESPEGNITFTLRTLKAFEQNSLAQVIEAQPSMQLPNGKVSFTPTGMYQIKTEALSHSLYMIDGKSVDVVLGTANLGYEDQVQERKNLVCGMDGALIDHLFIKYEELSREAYDGYVPQTDEEVKEVVESIHKSGEVT